MSHVFHAGFLHGDTFPGQLVWRWSSSGVKSGDLTDLRRKWLGFVGQCAKRRQQRERTEVYKCIFLDS